MPAQPDRTTTFLFIADAEEFDAPPQRSPDAVADIPALRNGFFHAEVGSRGGRVFKERGDVGGKSHDTR